MTSVTEIGKNALKNQADPGHGFWKVGRRAGACFGMLGRL